jgi:hypothetical protein
VTPPLRKLVENTALAFILTVWMIAGAFIAVGIVIAFPLDNLMNRFTSWITKSSKT